MKTIRLQKSFILTASFCTALLLAVSAQGQVRYESQPTGNSVKMEGTSSVHDWSMESVVIAGYIEADANFPESALKDAKAAKPTVSLFMPVRSFKSSNSVMDARMQETMKEKEFKKIGFKLIELKPKSAPGTKGAIQFDAVGALTIVGNTRTNTMTVTIEKVGDNNLKVTGKTTLKMTDYSVEPPKLSIPAIGDITTGDELKLAFEWNTAVKPKQ